MTLHRRQVLNLAATSLAAMTVFRNAPSAAAPPARRRRYRKAVGLGMVAEGETLADKLKLLVDLGFEGVELDAPNDFSSDEVLAARDAAGIAICGVVDSVHWQAPLSHPDPAVRRRGREGLEAAIRDASTFGARHVLLVPAVVNEEVPYDVAWERSSAEIRAVLPLAEELDVSINIENVWNHFLLSPLEAARYVDQFKSEHVGWHFDVGNIVNYGWPEQWIRILGKRIRRVHVKEFSRKKRDNEGLWKGFAVEIGEGDCGWERVMPALDEVGYENGWFVAEVGGGDRERLLEVAARMDRVLSM